MTKIFVAGAYNGDNIIECLDNIKRGLKVCAYLLSKGYLPFCPWTDFLFHLVSDADWTPTLKQYREYCLHLIEISDIVFVISGYNTHEGVVSEVAFARDHNIVIIVYDHDNDKMIGFYNQGEYAIREEIRKEDELYWHLKQSIKQTE